MNLISVRSKVFDKTLHCCLFESVFFILFDTTRCYVKLLYRQYFWVHFRLSDRWYNIWDITHNITVRRNVVVITVIKTSSVNILSHFYLFIVFFSFFLIRIILLRLSNSLYLAPLIQRTKAEFIFIWTCSEGYIIATTSTFP